MSTGDDALLLNCATQERACPTPRPRLRHSLSSHAQSSLDIADRADSTPNIPQAACTPVPAPRRTFAPAAAKFQQRPAFMRSLTVSLRNVCKEAFKPAHSADSINAASVALPISVIRNPSALGIVRPHSSYTMAKKRSDVRPDPMSASAYDASPVPLVPAGSSAISNEPAPSRESIFEMLKRFFRSRPTVESLKAKGIYKPEPVFGSTLAAICQTEQTLVPRFIQVVTELIETKFLEIDGLYRVSGNLSAVQKIRCQVDQDRYQLLVAEEDVHVLTGALKLFFRELAEPVFPVKMAKDFLAAMQVANGKSRLRRFDDLLKSLPPENRETLKLLLRHLNTVAKHADKNRMQAHNLAIMFGPTLFQSGAEDRPVVKKSKDKKKKGKDEPAPVQSNSHLAFHMIMQGQIVEFLLTDGHRLEALQGPIRRQP